MVIINSDRSHGSPVKRITHVKKYCPLCKNQPCEQLGDYIFRCVNCGHEVNEAAGDPAYHHQVLVARPSIYHIGKTYIVKEGETRSQYFTKIRKDFENVRRYDKDSMFNPNNPPLPGRNNRTGQWMSAQYCNMSLEYSEDDLNKMLKGRK